MYILTFSQSKTNIDAFNTSLGTTPNNRNSRKPFTNKENESQITLMWIFNKYKISVKYDKKESRNFFINSKRFKKQKTG